MKYIIDFPITKDDFYHINNFLGKYPYPLYIKGKLDISKLKLREYSTIGEDCMGQNYTKMSQCWGLLTLDWEGDKLHHLYFFKTMDDFNMVLEEAKSKNLIIDEKPIKTVFDVEVDC